MSASDEEDIQLSASDTEGLRRRAEYNRLARTAKLKSLILEKVNFRLHPEIFKLDSGSLRRDIRGEAQTMSCGDTDGVCIANISWAIRMRYKKSIRAQCLGSYVIAYEGVEGYSKETVDMFVQTVGKAATYAYFRALYAQLDWCANLGSSPLPVLQFRAKV